MDEHGEDLNSKVRSTPLQHLEPQETDDFDKNVNRKEQGLPMSTKKKTVRRKNVKGNTNSAFKNETPEGRNKRLANMRERRKQRLLLETAEERLARLTALRERSRQKILTETDEEREKRLSYLRDIQRERIRKETKEEREKRLRCMSERQKERIRLETPEAREKRLALNRKRNRKLNRKLSRKLKTSPEMEPDDEDDDVLYMAESLNQAECSQPQSVAPHASMYVGGYRYQYNANEALQVQPSLIAVERVWSLRPNESVGDQVWFRNQV